MAKTNEHARTASGGRATGPPVWVWIAGPLVAVAIVFAVVALRRSDDSAPGARGAQSNDPGVVHIHGLGVNPRNGDTSRSAGSNGMSSARTTEGGRAVERKETSSRSRSERVSAFPSSVRTSA